MSKVTRRSAKLAGLAALSVAATALVLVGGAAAPAQAGPPEEAVLDWNANALGALYNLTTASPRPGAAQAPPVGAQHLAMVQGAVYDAVNMIDGGHEPYLDGLPSAPASASKPAAVATAAHHVLVGLGIAPVPALPAATQTWLNDAYTASLAAIPNGQAKTDGIAAGAAAAAAMLLERTGDGRYVPFSFTCGEDAGEWRPVQTALTCTTPPGPSDPFAWLAKVEPFTLKSNAQFRTKGPAALGSRKYAREYDEVKRLGGIGTTLTPNERTPAQHEVAQFFTQNPLTIYHPMLRGLAQSKGLTLVQQARLFALVSLAAADTAINVWDEKVFWSNWRPVTAIKLGDSDGNTRTVGDPAWTSFAGNPPYPDQSSGYNGLTGAVMHASKTFFGKDKVPFALTATVTIGVPEPTVRTRHYDRFTDVVENTIDARVWQGIHFRTSDEGGARIGKNVARWVDKHHLDPVDDDDDDDDEGDDDD